MGSTELNESGTYKRGQSKSFQLYPHDPHRLPLTHIKYYFHLQNDYKLRLGSYFRLRRKYIQTR